MRTGPLTIDDIVGVGALFELGAPWIWPRSQSDYWLYATLFSSTCRIARDDDGTLIAAVIGFRGQDADRAGEVYLLDVMTHPEHRRKGAIRTLIGEITDQARQWSCTRVWLTSVPENTAAHRTWLALGFSNPPSDYRQGDVNVARAFKGPGKDRTIFELWL